MLLKLLSLLIAASLVSPAYAKDELSNFIPGNYVLRTGVETQCSAGEFKVYNEDGLKLTMGGLHIFDLRNFKERIEDNIEAASKCFYDAEDSMDVVGTSTILVFKETYKCGDATKHILTRKATINKSAVSLDAVQEGEPAFKYSCSWVLGERKVNSAPSGAKKNKRKK